MVKTHCHCLLKSHFLLTPFASCKLKYHRCYYYQISPHPAGQHRHKMMWPKGWVVRMLHMFSHPLPPQADIYSNFLDLPNHANFGEVTSIHTGCLFIGPFLYYICSILCMAPAQLGAPRPVPCYNVSPADTNLTTPLDTTKFCRSPVVLQHRLLWLTVE